MPNPIVDEPEAGKLYLVKRNKSGDPDKRYQPAVFNCWVRGAADNMRYARVTWYYKDEAETVLDFSGLFKQLDRQWLRKEHLRRSAEFNAAKLTLAHVEDLLFVPDLLEKWTT